jgi:hypothetical protein
MQLPNYPVIEATPQQVNALLSADAVRQSTQRLYRRALEGHGLIAINRAALPKVVDDVVALMNKRFPDGNVPIHGRWRHLEFKGRNMLSEFGGGSILQQSSEQKLCVLTEMILVSVLLDAGAGAPWRFRLPSGELVGRSEGLALAALSMMAQGYFSNLGSKEPWRVDGQALANLKDADLERAFQVNSDNPLIGVSGRVLVLNRLGQLILKDKKTFPNGRPGDLFVALANKACSAPELLRQLLVHLGPMWPNRPLFHGISIGDVWFHPELEKKPSLNNMIAFHKLSQWLTYSLVESFAMAGVTVGEIDQLTGLAEYRNGGLLFDAGVFVPAIDDWQTRCWMPYDSFTIEWRALTVALLDEIALEVQKRFGKTAKQLPLANVLEGGTWTLGRQYAAQRRRDGGPPFHIESDGTLF